MSTPNHLSAVTSPTPISHSPTPTVKIDNGSSPADLEKAAAAAIEYKQVSVIDIEHAEVVNDPRKWSRTKKYLVLSLVSGASTIAGLSASIYNPGIADVERDLHTTSGLISLSLSLYIVLQGAMPILWSSISEIVGRKKVYVTSLLICLIGCIVAGTAKSMGVLIGMRCLQGTGGAAVISIGAATLADIFEPHERGTMMGIYYCAPVVGTAFGPLLGGALTQGFSWRATFYFIAIFTAIYMLAFVFFDDTFRRERSAVYVGTLRRRRQEHEKKERKLRELQQQQQSGSRVTVVGEDRKTACDVQDEEKPHKKSLEVGAPTRVPESLAGSVKGAIPAHGARAHDAGVGSIASPPVEKELKEIRLSLRDVNPIRPMVNAFRRPNNVAVLAASGIIYGFGYSIAYTSARTLGTQYGYGALRIGLVLLAFGIGCMVGSILGGRWSDHVFVKLREKNGGVAQAEMRLRSTRMFMIFLPPAAAGFGWVCEQNVHISAVCVLLFFSGFFSICIYSSTLAYIVDANVGRSSSAVALNSCFRGVMGFIAAEIAVPLQTSIGDGGLYSLWAGFLAIAELLVLLVWWRGGRWREAAEARDRAKNI